LGLGLGPTPTPTPTPNYKDYQEYIIIFIIELVFEKLYYSYKLLLMSLYC